MAGLEKKKILLALDGSGGSMSTVEFVAKVMPPVGSEVVLFHVFSRMPETFWDYTQEPESDVWMNKMKTLELEHEKTLQAVMQRARQALLDADFREQSVTVEIQNRVRGIARDIAAQSKGGYDLLVMGRNGGNPLNGVAVGSVAHKVIGILNALPVCVVTGKPKNQNIIVALDGSKGSMRAVDYLCSFVDKFDGNVILLHAMRRIGFPESSPGQDNPFEEVEKTVWEDARQLIEPFMDQAKARLVEAGVKQDNIMLKIATGVPSRAGALIEEAQNSRCGSIMVGRTGVSQVEDFNIGRVCNKVVQRAKDMAVWVVP
ncbi:MAG: universal stress protein [Desulfobacterales bacterium]|nr:MAG: universal stress protein [Desulfobacterales bacterium]